MASFADSTSNETADIQRWVMDELGKRMLLAGSAIEFVNNLDVEQKKIKDDVDNKVGRINSVVTEFNLVKDQLCAIHLSIKEKISEKDLKLTSTQEITDGALGKLQNGLCKISP